MVIITKKEMEDAINGSMTMAQACVKLHMHFNTFKRYAMKFGIYCPNQGGKGKKNPNAFGIYLQNRRVPLNDILMGKYPNFSTWKLKNKLIQNNIKENKCDKCGITEWLDKRISIELHHIDGDRTNHELSNLMMLCPNCHSQTDTYRSNNKTNSIKRLRMQSIINAEPSSSLERIPCALERRKKVQNRPSKAELEELTSKIPMTKIGANYGVSDTAIKKWCKKYNIFIPNRRGYWTKILFRK